MDDHIHCLCGCATGEMFVFSLQCFSRSAPYVAEMQPLSIIYLHPHTVATHSQIKQTISCSLSWWHRNSHTVGTSQGRDTGVTLMDDMWSGLISCDRWTVSGPVWHCDLFGLTGGQFQTPSRCVPQSGILCLLEPSTTHRCFSRNNSLLCLALLQKSRGLCCDSSLEIAKHSTVHLFQYYRSAGSSNTRVSCGLESGANRITAWTCCSSLSCSITVVFLFIICLFIF